MHTTTREWRIDVTFSATGNAIDTGALWRTLGSRLVEAVVGASTSEAARFGFLGLSLLSTVDTEAALVLPGKVGGRFPDLGP